MKQTFDIGIIGGGLAGLTLGILAQKKGFSAVIFEKEDYPRHKVCGEYISNESLNFLNYLIPGFDFNTLPKVQSLKLTTATNHTLNANLDLGGFGISRFKLDHLLAETFQNSGGKLLTKTKITSVPKYKTGFEVAVEKSVYECKAMIGAWGKRSQIDIRLGRDFIQEKNRALSGFLGIKYHARVNNFEKDKIQLHLFPGGYCGASSIEDDKVCICYLVDTAAFKKANSNLSTLEKEFLFKNKQLEKLFSESAMLFDKRVSISQISFEKKTQTEQGLLMIGDASGMIAPLCGNGMSMAFHEAKIASMVLEKFMNRQISQEQMLKEYARIWQKQFGRRLHTGRFLQRTFFNSNAMNTLIRMANIFPPLKSILIRQTHGVDF